MSRKKKAEKTSPSIMRRRSSIRALLRQAKSEGWPAVEISEGGRTVRFEMPDQDTPSTNNPWDRVSDNAPNKKRIA